MLQSITITNEDIINQIKISRKMPEIINAIITNRIMKNAISEAGIEINTEELQKEADQFRLIHQLVGTQDTWKWLERYSLTLENFEEIIYNNYISRQLANHLFNNKIEQYFIENQLDYIGVAFYEIILDNADIALELFYEIEEGECIFFDAAQQFIEDIELRRSGGYRGILYRKDLKPEITSAVFAAKPAQLLKPIVTSIGIHLIRVEEIIQPQLDEQMRSQIMLDLFSQWCRQEIHQIEIFKD